MNEYCSTHPLARHQRCNKLVGYAGCNQTLIDADLLILLWKKEEKRRKENEMKIRAFGAANIEVLFQHLPK